MLTKEEFFKKFGANIREYREERNLTIQELSKLTKIRMQYLKKIEAGKAYGMTSSYIFIFAKAFNIRPNEIIKGL